MGVCGVVKRCDWVSADPLYIKYHDQEWGVPVHDDRHFFEMLVLEGAQAGLSWITVLRKRENYRKVFDNFEVEKIAEYGEAKVERLLVDSGIIRNRRKILSAITNARAFIKIQQEFGTFDQYVWRFVGGCPRINTWESVSELPSKTEQSDALSKDLKNRGFNFVGSTICYSFMQATGLVNDHTADCHCAPGNN